MGRSKKAIPKAFYEAFAWQAVINEDMLNKRGVALKTQLTASVKKAWQITDQASSNNIELRITFIPFLLMGV